MTASKVILDEFKIRDAALVGFEFEFYYENGANKAASQLSSILGKKIVTAYKVTATGKSKGAHTEQEVSAQTFKIEYDFSGGKNMMELVTGPMPYSEAKIVMAKIMNWIGENGKTTDKSGLHLNISFDTMKVSKKISIQNLDRLKFILSYNEDFIYHRFPERENNVYARGIDHIYPANIFYFNDSPKAIVPQNYELPSEKYYGVNFKKLTKGYIEIRYIGGKGYHKKIKEVIEILDYTVKHLYQCLDQSDYDYYDLIALQKRLRDHAKFVKSFKTYDDFVRAYPNITVSVDLKLDGERMKVFWPTIQPILFNLIVVNGMRSGYYNYDSDMSTHQVKDCNFRRAFYLSNYEFVNCIIKNCTIERCLLAGCEITSTIVNSSKLMWGTYLKKSKIADSIIDKSVVIEEVYIDNKENLVRGELRNCIVRSGIMSDDVIVDDLTEFI